jgi:predicted RNA methylase
MTHSGLRRPLLSRHIRACRLSKAPSRRCPGDYRGRRVLDMGCGMSEYALWYALNGAVNDRRYTASQSRSATISSALKEGGPMV